MLDRLIGWALENRLPVLFLAAALLVAGAYTAYRMPVDVFPDLTAPTVTVVTEAGSMAPEEVETLVTFPIETAVNGATGVRLVRSSTTQGISLVYVEFDWGTDIFRARQIVGEKLQLAAPQLPAGIDPPILAPITSIMGEIMLVGVRSDDHSPIDVRTAADWVVRNRLLAIPGVAQVISLGGEVKEYQVVVQPERLLTYDVSLEQVITAAESANQVGSGGIYAASGQEFLIRGLGRAYDVSDLASTVVSMRGSSPVLLGDVAMVRIGPKPSFGTASVNTEPAVILSIQKQPEANTIELTRRIDAELELIQGQLPAGMHIDTGIFRQADFISVAVSNVVRALRDGAFLVVLILFLFLWNFRTTAISIIAIPLSLAAAILAMKLMGATINTMTLGGMAIAVGTLVDDAIIFTENVYRRLKQNRALAADQRRPAFSVVYDAAREIRSAVVNANLIMAVVIVPLFFLTGLEGRMLRPMGFAYVVSIFASLGVALTITPALCYYLLPKAPFMDRTRESWLVEHLKAWYARVLDVVVDRPRHVMAGAGIAVAFAVCLIPFLGRGFLPDFQEGTLTVNKVTLPGTAIAESDGIGRLVEQRLLDNPAVVSTARRTGRAELDEHAQGVNASEIDVLLNLNGVALATVMAELRTTLEAMPGTSVTIGQPIGHRIDHMMTGTQAAVAISVFGPDLYELRRIANRIEASIEDVPGVVDLQVEQQADVPQLRVVANRSAMAGYGVTPGQLTRAVQVAFRGETVSQVLEGQQGFDLVVRFDESARQDAAAIRRALIDTPLGPKVPLSQLADVYEDRGPNSISRENVQRKIVVQFNVGGRDVGSVVRDVREVIGSQVTIPAGYFVEYGGQFESGQAARRTIAMLTVFSVFAIFLILLRQFGSARTAALVMVNLPLALIGGILAVFIAGGGILNVATLVGFIALFGIAARNGILLVSHYDHLLREGLHARTAVIRGSMERLNPILMTALTAGLALLPLALGGGEPGKEIETPMAIVVLGGLLTSTALNMVVVPSLFLRFGRPPRKAD